MALTTKSYEVTPEDFKDNSGRWRTRSLFMETNPDESKYPSIFTLADTDQHGRISMRRIYLEANDPTEYMAARDIFGTVDCWNNLCNSSFFKPHLDKWRSQLHCRIRSKAVKQIIEAAYGITDANAQRLNAAKWLATQQWNDNKPIEQKRGPGRPPKLADPETRLREALEDDKEIDEDYLRIVGKTKDSAGKSGS